MKIGGLQKITLIDYPGRLAAIIFLSGCNFRCPFCYSAELVLPEKIQNHPRIPEKEVFDFLSERRGLLEGVVLCGGEPTIYRELPSFIKKIKKLGYLVKLDTNGSNPQALERLIKNRLIDYVAMDIKAPKERYSAVVGDQAGFGLAEAIEQSIDILKKGEVEYEFRSTIVPAIHKREDVIAMAKWIRGAKKYYLQNFRAEKTINPDFEKEKSYPKEWFLDVQKAIAPFFEVCQVR